MENMDLNEQERNRREALGKLRELGIDPYPAALYPVNATAQKIKDVYDPEKGNLADVVIAGRIMSRRIMGAASFIELQDETAAGHRRHHRHHGLCFHHPDRPAVSTRERTDTSEQIAARPPYSEGERRRSL